MKRSTPVYEKYIFVCENERVDAPCCGARGGAVIREKLKDRVKARGLAKRIRVSRAGCLDVCSEGPNVLLMPDQVWFSGVSESDVDEIVSAAEISARRPS